MQKLVVDAIRKINGCESTAKDWNDKGKKYESKTGFPVVEVYHGGDHKYPDWAPALCVKFFQENKKP
jgi:hypothetical protein